MNSAKLESKWFVKGIVYEYDVLDMKTGVMREHCNAHWGMLINASLDNDWSNLFMDVFNIGFYYQSLLDKERNGY